MKASNQPAVFIRVEELVLPTYLPAAPDRNPMFLEKRVYPHIGVNVGQIHVSRVVSNCLIWP